MAHREKSILIMSDEGKSILQITMEDPKLLRALDNHPGLLKRLSEMEKEIAVVKRASILADGMYRLILATRGKNIVGMFSA